eukprot:55636_1
MLFPAVCLSLIILTDSYKISNPHFISHIEQLGAVWTVPYNEELLSSLGVPGYSNHPYNVLKFGAWNSGSEESVCASAAYAWEYLSAWIIDPALRMNLTGSLHPTSNELRTAIKGIYDSHNITLFISAGNSYLYTIFDYPQRDRRVATDVATSLSQYAVNYSYDGVDINWQEPLYFNHNGDGEIWLTNFTAVLYNTLSNEPTKYYITHSPAAPSFGGTYTQGAYLTVHTNVGHMIDWYNIQFCNQGISYNTFETMFIESIGWSSNSSVYQMIKGQNAYGISIPAEKIVIGKLALGGTSDYVDGTTLNSIFNQAISVANDSPIAWNTGFMMAPFYSENHQTPKFQVVNEAIGAFKFIANEQPNGESNGE